MIAGAQLDVCGSHCDSPKQFYLHILKNKETLEKIMRELDEVYSDLRPNDSAIANPVVGMFCAAKYPGKLSYNNRVCNQFNFGETTRRFFNAKL